MALSLLSGMEDALLSPNVITYNSATWRKSFITSLGIGYDDFNGIGLRFVSNDFLWMS